MNRPSPGGTRRRSVFTAHLENTAARGEQPNVLEDMRAAILRGDEPPGTMIPIDAVASFFGVSQIPVREALKILLGEGLVEHVPRVGYSVAKLTFQEFRELYEARLVLEEASLRLAVERATPDDDARVRELLEELDEARHAAAHRDYHEATRAFHLALIAPSGMRRLQQMYESAWNLTEPARPMARVHEHAREQFRHDHKAMARAFFERDAEWLVACTREHYEHLLESIAPLADDLDTFRPAE
ncbi:MAG: GntR family transcriptional regulator [Aeromicrobium sp.]|uniref:GntR family transcriptional regulator n=1 Tax=Aeromicrobium sp. TaxID=1871063 RepID=UPI0039E6C771